MITQLSMELIKRIASSSFDREKMGFQVTGGKWWENRPGTIDDIPKLVNYFLSLKKATFWLTPIEKSTGYNGKVYYSRSSEGKRTIIWRKGENYLN